MKNSVLTGQIFIFKIERLSTEVRCPSCWTTVIRYQAPFYWVELEGLGAIATLVDCDGCGHNQVACPLAFDTELAAHALITAFTYAGLDHIPSHYSFIGNDWTKHGPLDSAVALSAERLGPYMAVELKRPLIIRCDTCQQKFAQLPKGALIVGSPLEELWMVLNERCLFCRSMIISPIVVGTDDIAPNAQDIGTFAGWPWGNHAH